MYGTMRAMFGRKSPLERARAFEREGSLDAALAAYREAATEDPAAGEPRIRIVGLHLLAGRTADAEHEARDFVARADSSDAHATLGQVLRLTFRLDEAVASFSTALARAPGSPGLRALLNDARRAKYWTPTAELHASLAARERAGPLPPADAFRFFHARFAGLLSPDVQRWLVAADGRDELPRDLVAALDAKFEGRFSRELGEVVEMAESLRRRGPYAPARARITTASRVLDGEIIDTDSTILGAFEVVEGDAYAIVPFAEVRALEVVKPGPYFAATLTRRDGAERSVEIPALYFFTEGCRTKQAREGSMTVWRTLRGPFRVGLGLRDFYVRSEGKPQLLGLDGVRRIEFA
jgi:protein involved in temperature-dependent protein secretion